MRGDEWEERTWERRASRSVLRNLGDRIADRASGFQNDGTRATWAEGCRALLVEVGGADLSSFGGKLSSL